MTIDPQDPRGDADPAEARSAERLGAILDERARALARVPEPSRVGESLDVLVFELEGQRYAIEARWALEVLWVEEIVLLPGAPDFIAGLFNRRGEILLAADVRALFGGGPSSGDGARRLIVIGEERAELGLVVGAVPEHQRLRVDDIHLVAALVPGDARDLVLGTTGEGLLVVDVRALLTDARLILDQAEQTDEPHFDP